MASSAATLAASTSIRRGGARYISVRGIACARGGGVSGGEEDGRTIPSSSPPPPPPLTAAEASGEILIRRNQYRFYVSSVRPKGRVSMTRGCWDGRRLAPSSTPTPSAAAMAAVEHFSTSGVGSDAPAGGATGESEDFSEDFSDNDISEDGSGDGGGVGGGGGPEPKRKKKRQQKPSVLLSLPQPYNSGMALGILTSRLPKGEFVRMSDFRDLAEAARRGEAKDARAIAHALVEFRRCNRMIVNSDGARAAMEGMVRGMTPSSAATTAQMTEAILFALERGLLREKTGLYYAYRTEDIDDVLSRLLELVREDDAIRLPEGFDHTAEVVEEEVVNSRDPTCGIAHANGLGAESIEPSALAKRVLRTTSETLKLAVRRGFCPERNMRKRAARRYRKWMRLDPASEEEGNASRRTADLGVRIALELGSTAKCARDMFLTPYRAAHNVAGEGTVKLVVEKKAEERAEKAERMAAMVAAAEEVEEDGAVEEGEQDADGEEEKGAAEGSREESDDKGEEEEKKSQ